MTRATTVRQLSSDLIRQIHGTDADWHGCRYATIGGHFHQPPSQDPYWIDKIVAESYDPLSKAQIDDWNGQGPTTLNTYQLVSHDISECLRNRLAHEHPALYRRMIEADAHSRAIFGGHGSAMLLGSPYHAILPLLTPRDLRIHVARAFEGFVRDYGRRPTGAFPPEGAVNDDVLQAFAEAGIEWVVLSPHQAQAWRRGDGEWVHHGVDTRRPYLWQGRNGHSLVVVFYDHGISEGVAYNGLLRDAGRYMQRIYDAFDWQRESGEPQLVSVFTDGESHGHYTPYGDKCLARLLTWLLEAPQVRLTTFGQFVAAYRQFVQQHPEIGWCEVKILRNSAWSCPHTAERWGAREQNQCSCGGGHWQWRQPLRDLLGGFVVAKRDELFSQYGAPLLTKPDAARVNYSPDMEKGDQAAFLARFCKPRLRPSQQRDALRLLRASAAVDRAQNSCALFFEEPSRGEAGNCLMDAMIFVIIARQYGWELEPEVVDHLARIPSNQAQYSWNMAGYWGKILRPKALAWEFDYLLNELAIEFRESTLRRLAVVLEAMIADGHTDLKNVQQRTAEAREAAKQRGELKRDSHALRQAFRDLCDKIPPERKNVLSLVTAADEAAA